MNYFPLILGLGASLGLWRVAQSVPRWQTGRWVRAGLALLLASLLGARLSYVLAHGGYYRTHPLEAPQIWLGGLDWPGALLGGLLALIVISRWWGMALARLADGLLPLLAPVVVAAWLGCWLAGVSYGPPVPAGAWWGVPSPQEGGLVTSRLPLQALAALASLGLYAWLEIKFPHHNRDGQPASLAALGLGLILLGASLLSAEPAPRWHGLRSDTWTALVFSLLAALSYGLCRLQSHPKPVS